MVIDFHLHCYTNQLAARAMSLLPADKKPSFDGTLDGLCRFLAESDFEFGVALNIANKPEHNINVNNWAIDCNKRQRVVAFGSIHPFFDGFRAELRRLKEAGIKGLKFHPYYQKYEVDDRAAYPVYEAAAAEGFVMLFHTGLDSMAPGAWGTTDKFARVVADLGYDKMVAAHLGGSLQLDMAADKIWGQNIYLDTSLAFRFLDDAGRRRLLESHDPRKILFASDAPWTGTAPDFKAFDECDWLGASEKEAIFCGNAKRLLGV